jgi:putative membrane protein
MKKFDKGYIYSNLVSDFVRSLFVFFIFFEDFFFDEEANSKDIIAALPIFALGLAVIYLCFIVYRILYYKTSGYELTETSIKCKKGVFFRKRSELDYKKVHAINKKQGLINRIFGIAVLTVDSGSANTSHQAEITIIEKEKTVDALLNELNAAKDNGTRDSENAFNEEELLLSDKDSLYSFTSKKKMLYTLINIASTAFFTALFLVLAIVIIGVCKLILRFDFFGNWGQYILFSFLIAVGAVLLSSVLSFVGSMVISFVRYHDFNITKCNNNIQISFGLLEKHTNAFSYNRIKAVKISQGLVQRMLGFATIKLEVIGYTGDSEDENMELGVLVPFCKYEEIGEILSRILPDYIPEEKQTKAISFFPFISWFSLIFGSITGIILLLTVVIMLLVHASSIAIIAAAASILGAGLLVFSVNLVSSALSYKLNGIAFNHRKVTVYSGGFTKNITVFMAKNLVAVENVTTPLRKKAGIASLVMHLKTNEATNEVKVHIQNDCLSEKLEGLLIL